MTSPPPKQRRSRVTSPANGSPVFKRPLRVLAAIANPAGLDAYGLQQIEVETEAALLCQAAEGVDIDLTFLEQPCTLAAIEEALRSDSSATSMDFF